MDNEPGTQYWPSNTRAGDKHVYSGLVLKAAPTPDAIAWPGRSGSMLEISARTELAGE